MTARGPRRAAPGWDQEIISATRVGVAGADLAAAFAVKACRLAGVGDVRWAGAPTPRSSAVISALLPGDPALLSYPYETASAAELDWALGTDLHVLLVTSPCPRTQQAATQVASRRGIPILFATTTGDRGWFATSAPPPPSSPPDENAVLALCAAAMLWDTTRELRCPRRGLLPPDGELLSTSAPAGARPERVMVVGVGGIGSWLTAALALTPGQRVITLVDHDRVEPRNLGNQLFTAADATAGAYKAIAAQRLLQPLATGDVCLLAQTNRAAAGFQATLADDRADAVASCVDNAATRLLLQQAARASAIPLATGSIDAHAADCHVQTPAGPTLDEQLRGQLSHATSAPVPARAGGCTGRYLAAGMMAAAMVGHRITHSHANPVAPMHWRTGRRPCEGAAPR